MDAITYFPNFSFAELFSLNSKLWNKHLADKEDRYFLMFLLWF